MQLGVSLSFSLSEVWVQSRGFKTLKSKTRRLQSSYETPAESESYTPQFMKVRKQSWSV